MKKSLKRLSLARETVRSLSMAEMEKAAGGTSEVYSCTTGCYSVPKSCASLCPC